MRKEIYIDCRKKDLGKIIKDYNISGILGKTSIDGIRVLDDYKIIKIRPETNIFEKMSKLRGRAEYVIVEAEEWPIINLENAIACAQFYSMKIATKVKNLEEAELAITTLQTGVDALIVEDVNIINDVCNLVNKKPENIKLVNAKVMKVQHAGIAERICIDTTRRLYELEGMLIGSQASGLFLIEAEVYETPYIEPRPFRVNAGSLNAYILTPGNRTKYLSELKIGDRVCIVDKNGNMRIADVGRIKEETRPMSIIEAEYEGKRYKTFVQRAETMRLVGDRSIPLTELISLSSKNELKKRDVYVKLRIEEKARHFGMATDTYVEER